MTRATIPIRTRRRQMTATGSPILRLPFVESGSNDVVSVAGTCICRICLADVATRKPFDKLKSSIGAVQWVINLILS